MSADVIERVETFVVGTWCFVRLTTRDGVQGIGESTAFAFPTAVREVVESVRDYLVGADPRRVEHHWLMLYRALGWRGITLGGAISAIDQALWDIKARQLGVPVWELLGGRSRTAVRAMKVVSTGSPEEVVAGAVEAQQAGYTAIKLLLFQHEHHQMSHAERIEDMVARLGGVRDAVGQKMDIGVELHRNMQPGNSVALIRELAVFRPFFVEDPVPPDSALSFGEVAAKSSVPMAAGERNTTIYEFREYVERAGISFVRPDIGIAGGFTHARKICALAEAHHQGVLPHAVPSGPVATMAHVHLGLSVPNFEAQEHVEEDHGPASEVVEQVAPLVDGWLHPLDGPGLGLTLVEERLRTAQPTVHAISPDLRPDGSVALR